MSRFNTHNPVPSTSVKDYDDNAQIADELLHLKSPTTPDRFGQPLKTWYGVLYDAQQAIANFGYILIDSFQLGATITLQNQALRWTLPDGDGEYYRWDGVYPSGGKIVSPGSTPASSGGVGKGAWVSVGDAALRLDLASPNGGDFVHLQFGTVSNAIRFLTPDMFTNGGYSGISAALTAMCDFSRQYNMPVVAWGYTGTLDGAISIEGVRWMGGTLKGNKQITASEGSRISDLVLDGPFMLHGGGDLYLDDVEFMHQTSTAALSIQDLTKPSRLWLTHSLFHDCKYGILQQGGSGEKLITARISDVGFKDLTGDAIEMNVVNGHYQEGGLIIENITLDNINNRDGSPNWGIGIGISGVGPYDINAPDSQYASNFIVRNIVATRTRQCVHFEMSRNFQAENLELYPDTSASPSSGLTFAGVVAYGCKKFTIDGVSGEPMGTGTRMVYLSWGVSGGAYKMPCMDFTVKNVITETGTVEISTSCTDDISNDFTIESISSNIVKHRGFGSSIKINDIHCKTFDAIIGYAAGEGEGGGVYNRGTFIEAEIKNIISVGDDYSLTGSIKKLYCDRLYTSGCNFDVKQQAVSTGQRGYLLGSVTRTFNLTGDTFPQGVGFQINDVLFKLGGGKFVIQRAGVHIGDGDTIKAAPAGQGYIESTGEKNWATSYCKTAGTSIIIPGGASGGGDLRAMITHSSFAVGGVYRVEISPSLGASIPDGTIIRAADPINLNDGYIEIN